MGPVILTPRPAATVLLLRPGLDGRAEVLLGRRASAMAFAPGMHVFPGGRVDEGDADPRLVARSTMTPAAAAEALGGDLAPAAAHAAFVAAIRESFEETGVLLADHRDGAGPDDLEAARRRLLAETDSWPALAEALDLRLRTDLLVPLSRWVTPIGLPRRFDTRFFVAAVKADTVPSVIGSELDALAWHSPGAALDAMARGTLGMWLPTATSLQQVRHVRSIEDVRDRLSPRRLEPVAVDRPIVDGRLTEDVLRIRMPAGGGIAGQPVNAYLVGRTSFVLVDPGDPTGPGLERAIVEAAAAGGTIRAIVLTHTDPDHAAGAETLRERLGIPVSAGVRADTYLPFALGSLADGATVIDGDVPLRVIATPGPTADHVALVVGDGSVALSGDLDGGRGARSMLGPPDQEAWARSVERLRSIVPSERWLGGHPAPEEAGSGAIDGQ